MVQAGRGGSIVNIGSMWAHQAIGATPSSGYSLAKGRPHALTRNLALELAPHRIRVNTVAPAVVATPIYEKFVPEDKIDETLHSFDGFHPLGRVGTVCDLANDHHLPALPGHQAVHAHRWSCRSDRWPDPGTALAQIVSAPEGSIEPAARGMVKGAGHPAIHRCRCRHAMSRAQLVHARGMRRVGERRFRCAG